MSDDKPIHDFTKFKKALRELGYTIGSATPWIPLQVADVNMHNIQSGEVEITDEGIFYVDPQTGTKHEVFLYKRNYDIAKYGKPRFHVRNCQIIQQIGRDQYRRANTGKVIVWDRSKGMDVEVSDLPLCGYCRGILKQEGMLNYNTSVDFEEILRQANEVEEEQDEETDLKGYSWKWMKLSTAYREKRDYTCERCGYKPVTILGRQDIQVHHKDGNKLNNKENNFECLCVACHADVDDRHRENFSKGANKKILEAFKKAHPEAGIKRKTGESRLELLF